MVIFRGGRWVLKIGGESRSCGRLMVFSPNFAPVSKISPSKNRVTGRIVLLTRCRRKAEQQQHKQVSSIGSTYFGKAIVMLFCIIFYNSTLCAGVKVKNRMRKVSVRAANSCISHNKYLIILTFFLRKQSLKALLCSRIESRSIRVVNDEGRVCYLAADEPRWIDSAATMCHE